MLEGLLDVWLIGYVVAAAGITELVMRFTPEGFTRRRWGAIVCIGTALLASALGWVGKGYWVADYWVQGVDCCCTGKWRLRLGEVCPA